MSGGLPDEPIQRAAVVGTAVFVVLAVAALAADVLAWPYAIASIGLFAVGIVAFVATLLRAADRSRAEELTVSGLWWLSGSAPKEVRRTLLGAFGVQVVVALVAASIRPFTGVAFGILAPLFGLGLAGLWGARHGTFGPRATPPKL